MATSDRDVGGQFLPDYGTSEYAVIGRLSVGLRGWKTGLDESADLVADFEDDIERLGWRMGTRVRFFVRQARYGFTDKKDVDDNVSRDAFFSARKIRNHARRLAPIDTGRLRRSGSVERHNARYAITFTIHFDPAEPREGGPHYYGLAVHETHPTMSHFLSRAFTAGNDGFIRDVEKILRKSI